MLDDSFSVSLTGTVLFFFLLFDGTNFSMYPFSFSYLSFSWFCPALFIFFFKKETDLQLRSSVLRLLYYHMSSFLFLSYDFHFSLVFIKPFYPQSIFLYLVGFLLQFLLKGFEVFFFSY